MAGQVLADSGRDDLVALKVANEVLGGNFLSRINTDLRETKGWSYGTRTRITTSEDRVAFTMSAPVQADKTGASIIALIDHSKSFLGPKGITGDELVQTVNGNVRGLPGSFETSGDVMGGLLSLVNLGRPDNYYEALAEKYHGLTTAEIDATARKTLDPGKLVFVVVGDAKKVRPQLDAVGLPVEDVQAPSAQ